MEILKEIKSQNLVSVDHFIRAGIFSAIAVSSK
jgi:hypothetical protein